VNSIPTATYSRQSTRIIKWTSHSCTDDSYALAKKTRKANWKKQNQEYSNTTGFKF